MRLSKQQVSGIKKAFSNHLTDYELRLFGSRTDDNKKGGDIDLLVLTRDKIELKQKWQIRRDIENAIGEQKIDIVNFAFSDKSNFKQVILEDALVM